MKVIVAGSRTINSYAIVSECILNSNLKITELVSGCAIGVDSLGLLFAENYKIPTKKFPANWKKYGKSAGFIRNKQMAEYANCLILIWDGISKGSANMLKLAKEKNLIIFETII